MRDLMHDATTSMLTNLAFVLSDARDRLRDLIDTAEPDVAGPARQWLDDLIRLGNEVSVVRASQRDAHTN